MAIEQYHTGLVVADVAAAMDELSTAMGIGWTNVQRNALKLRGPDGPFNVDLTFVYSTTFPYLELIEGVEGTVWAVQPDGASAAHHLGCWSDDLAADSAALEAAGSPLLVTYQGRDDTPVGFAYHRMRNGVLLELVDSARRPQLDEWLAGGEWLPPGS